MPIARRGGTETFWRSWGDDPQTLLIHCSLAHSGAWKGLAERLGLSAVAFDMPGHGQSGPWNRAVDIQTQTLAMTKGFVADRPMDVIGHSFGATVALRLAIEQPQSVRRLVLIEPVFFAAARGTDTYTDYVAEMQPFAEAIEADDPVLAARRFTEIWGVGVAWEDMRAAQRTALADQINIIPAQDGALFQDNAGLLLPGRLERAGAPVLLLEGGKSPPIISAIAEALAARLPDARRAVVSAASHMLPITHPAETAALIGPFLNP